MSPYATAVTFVIDDAPVTRGFSSPSHISPGLGVEQEVELEVPPVALRAQPLAHRDRALARVRRWCSVSSSGRRRCRTTPRRTGVSSGNPVSSAINGPTSVPCRVITPSIASSRGSIRFITLSLSPSIFLRARPSRLPRDEERGLTGVPVRRLHDEVVAEARLARPACKRRVGRSPPIVFGTLGTPASFAEPRRLDLRVQPVAERRRRERDLEPELARELLGLLVEHQERRLAARRLTATRSPTSLCPSR